MGNMSTEPPETGAGQGRERARSELDWGEGSYKAGRLYKERIDRFMATGDVERLAREAAPRDARELAEMEEAEREGRSRSRGER